MTTAAASPIAPSTSIPTFDSFTLERDGSIHSRLALTPDNFLRSRIDPFKQLVRLSSALHKHEEFEIKWTAHPPTAMLTLLGGGIPVTHSALCAEPDSIKDVWGALVDTATMEYGNQGPGFVTPAPAITKPTIWTFASPWMPLVATAPTTAHKKLAEALGPDHPLISITMARCDAIAQSCGWINMGVAGAYFWSILMRGSASPHRAAGFGELDFATRCCTRAKQ